MSAWIVSLSSSFSLRQVENNAKTMIVNTEEAVLSLSGCQSVDTTFITNYDLILLSKMIIEVIRKCSI